MSYVQKRGTSLIKAKMKAELDGSGNVITSTYATKQELANALEGAVTILPNSTLPSNPSEGVFYLVPTDTANVYDRYVYENNSWINLGVSSLNMTNYPTKSQAVSSFSVSGTTVTYTKADGNTGTFTTQDANVTNILGTTTKAYVTGTTSATTATTGQVFDTGVYLSSTAGELVATTFKGALDGNADTATKLETARNLNIQDADSTNTGTAASFDGSGNATIKLPSTIKATLTGNASSATEFSATKTVELTGDVTGSDSSKAGWSVTTTLSNSGVTAGNYGPADNASPSHSGTFSVPYFTVDAKGRVTAASTKTITLPSDNNTDTQVTNTLATTTKAYVTGTTSATTSTGTQVFDTGVYLSATAGELVATKFTGALNGTADKASKDANGNVIASTYTTDANFVKVIETLDSVTTSLSKVLQFLTDYYEISATSDSE